MSSWDSLQFHLWKATVVFFWFSNMYCIICQIVVNDNLPYSVIFEPTLHHTFFEEPIVAENLTISSAISMLLHSASAFCCSVPQTVGSSKGDVTILNAPWTIHTFLSSSTHFGKVLPEHLCDNNVSSGLCSNPSSLPGSGSTNSRGASVA